MGARKAGFVPAYWNSGRIIVSDWTNSAYCLCSWHENIDKISIY